MMPTNDLDLQPGHAVLLPIERGLAVHVASGAVTVSGPLRWLAETVYIPSRHLGAGDIFIAEGAGWMRIDAAGTARVRVRHAEQQPSSAARQRLARMRPSIVRGLMRVFGRAGP